MVTLTIKRIALIEKAGKERFNIYTLTRMPRGITLLAAIMKNLGYEVSCYVESIKKIKWQDLMNYDLIGFSIISCTAKPTYEMIEKLRAKGYEGEIVVGGPHATTMPEESLSAGAKVVVRHEGDKTFPELVAAINDKTRFYDIDGITWIEDDITWTNPDRPFLTEAELSKLPFPLLESIVGLDRMNLMPLTFSRGCPYGCEFCGVEGMYGKKYRAASLDWRIQQLTTLKHEYPGLWQTCPTFLTDDNLNGTPRTKKITIAMLGAMVRENLVPPKGFICQMKVTDITPELAKLLKDTNCLFVCLGIESVDDENLELMDKQQTAREIQNALSILKEYGVAALAMTIVGTDVDTFWSFWRSIRLLQKWGITYLQVLALVPLTGTKMTRRLEEEGRQFDHNYNKHNGMHPVIKAKRISKFGIWAAVYLIGFVWFYVPMLFRKDFKFRRLIWIGFVQLLKQLWRNAISS